MKNEKTHSFGIWNFRSLIAPYYREWWHEEKVPIPDFLTRPVISGTISFFRVLLLILCRAAANSTPGSAL